MRRMSVKKIGKAAVMMGRAAQDPKCRAWSRKVRRATALMLTHPRLTKVM